MQENKINRFIVIFPFDERGEHVALIRRRRSKIPTMIGKWNGFGGQTEEANGLYAQASQLFKKEAGVEVPASKFNEFGKLRGKDFEVHMFVVIPPSLEELINEDGSGEIKTFKVDTLPKQKMIYVNVCMCVFIALESAYYTEIKYDMPDKAST